LSIGVAQTGPDTVLAAEDFVPKADAAMYELKNNPAVRPPFTNPLTPVFMLYKEITSQV